MTEIDPVVTQEIPLIRKIIADETWLEGERRGSYVSSDDPVVRERVCDVIMAIGAKLREMFEKQTISQPCPVLITDHNKAA